MVRHCCCHENPKGPFVYSSNKQTNKQPFGCKLFLKYLKKYAIFMVRQFEVSRRFTMVFCLQFSKNILVFTRFMFQKNQVIITISSRGFLWCRCLKFCTFYSQIKSCFFRVFRQLEKKKKTKTGDYFDRTLLWSTTFPLLPLLQFCENSLASFCRTVKIVS